MQLIMRRVLALGAFMLALALVALTVPEGAAAHERRDLVSGKYEAVVGFLNEPAYQGQMNSLSLVVTSKTEKDASGNPKPIEGLEKTVKAQVLADGKTLDLTVQTRFNMLGAYAGYFMPTAAGQYRFRIYGEINGEKIDEMFESGPGRFSDIASIGPLQFPNQVTNAPTDLQAQLDAARSTANTARLLAIAGVVIGAFGLVVGGTALLRRPAAATPADQVASQVGQGDE